MFGLLNTSWWQDLVILFVFTQITIASVTLYLHRSQTHRAVVFHPVINHFFRFWLWLTTGMVTAEWVAIHRKHHAATDTEGDPHSPVVLGLKKVLLEGAELYRASAKDKEMVDRYRYGTPEDWIERRVYTPHSAKGIFLMLSLNVLLFGLPGLSMWAIQMMWIPFWAAGVINGVGHYWGYRNFKCKDSSRNIFPLGLWIGGEELHNNHHAFASSAKFSIQWWEFDLGWLYIRCLSFFKLAKVKKLAPKIVRDKQLLKAYYEDVFHPMLRREMKMSRYNKEHRVLLERLKQMISIQKTKIYWALDKESDFYSILNRFETLKSIYEYRTSLQAIWMQTRHSQKEWFDSLHEWCKSAEASGVERLAQFSKRIKGNMLFLA